MSAITSLSPPNEEGIRCVPCRIYTQPIYVHLRATRELMHIELKLIYYTVTWMLFS